MFVWPWHLGALDWGPVWPGYLGLFLFSGAAVAVGMFFSSITESQIIAFFMTSALLVFLATSSAPWSRRCTAAWVTPSRS